MKKKSLLICLCASFALLFLLSVILYAASVQEWEEIENGFAGGSGTIEDPYLIDSIEQLQHFQEHYLTIMDPLDGNYHYTYYKLTSDLVFNDETFTFRADTGLVEVTDGKNLAYFGTGIPGTDEGDNTVFDEVPSEKGVWYASMDSTEKGSYKGELNNFLPIGHDKRAFAGSFDGDGHTISGLFIYDDRDAYRGIGLFANMDDGILSSMKMTNSLIYSKGRSVNIGIGIGSFAGNASKISRLSSNAIVIGGNENVGYIGGIAGTADTAQYCSFSGVVNGGDNVGGVVGAAYQISACRLHEGTVYGREAVGGVVGYMWSKNAYIYQSYAKGSVKGTLKVGGVIGDCSSENAKIRNCYSHADVSGDTYVGGIAGKAAKDVSIQTSYNAGKVSATTAYCGGLVGESLGAFSSCYHIKNRAVIGNTYQGTVGAAEGSIATDASGTAAIQSSPNFQSTYKGFDFNTVWCQIDYSYPSLRCESVFAFPVGSGTARDPYHVDSAEQLALLVQSKYNYKDEHFLLTTDITLNDEIFTFNPDTGLVKVTDGKNTAYIGTGYPGDDSGSNTFFDKKASERNKWYASENSDDEGAYTGELTVWMSDSNFYGNFDGGGHTVTGLYSEHYGLFHHASSVQNIHIQNSLILGKLKNDWYTSTGSIATSIGYMNGCTSNAIVLSHGGLTGSCGIIEKSEFSGVVISNNNEYYEDIDGVGGIAGRGGTFFSCRNRGTVLGDEYVGGIVGYHTDKAYNCINEGKVVATEHFAGGIVGYSEHSKILTSYNVGEIRSYYYAGGIAGYCTTEQDSYGSIPSKIEHCYYASDSVFVKNESQNQGVGCRYDYTEQTITDACPDKQGECAVLNWEQFSKKESFVGFDFVNVYALPEGEPYPIFLHEVTDFETGEVLWDGSASKFFAGGNGTEKSPYLITTPEELKYFAYTLRYFSSYKDDYYALGADIVLNDTSFTYWYKNAVAWEVIEDFTGVFDGQGYTIRGLYMEGNGESGLFLKNNGTIRNLKLEDVYLSSYEKAGGIAVTNNGTIQNCHVQGFIEAKYESGGIACINKGTIQNCAVDSYMSGFDIIGGIVNENNGTVQSCEMNGSMDILMNAGGIVYTNNGTVKDCENNADIEAGERVGGIVKDNNGTVESCQNSGNLYGEFQAAGVVYHTKETGKVAGCQNYGDVTSLDAAAGICAIYSGTEPLSDCQNNGTVTSSSYGGGIVSYLYTIAENCQNRGTVQGRYTIGGIVGELKNSALVQSCQNYAPVVGTVHTVGGIAGRTQGSLSSVINCENYAAVNGKEKVGGIVGNTHAFASDKAPADIHSNRNYGTVSGEFEVGGISGNNNRLIYNCYNSGEVSGLYNVGGIAGLSGYDRSGFYLGSIRDCFNAGAVSAEYNVGGIAGYANGKVNTCYNIGNVLGDYFVGSIIGESKGENAIEDCYYLFGCANDGTVRQNAVGNSENGQSTKDNAANELALTENQMKNADNLSGFDFNTVWMLLESENQGLPQLRTFHIHVFDEQIPDESHLKSAATCQEQAWYYKSCLCGQNGTDAFIHGDIGAHTLSELTADSSCHYKTCSLCMGIFEHEEHRYSNACDNVCNVCSHAVADKHVYDYAVNSNGHEIACTTCGMVKNEISPHSYDNGAITKAPTKNSKGEITYTCKECGYQYAEPIYQEESEQKPLEPEISNPIEKEESKNKQENGKDTYSSLCFLVGIATGCVVALTCTLPFLLKKRKSD